MRWLWSRTVDPAPRTRTLAERRSDDAMVDAHIEAEELAALPCTMCDDIGEPHVCEREWWRSYVAHRRGGECSDVECRCHEAADLEHEAADIRLVLREAAARQLAAKQLA